MVSIEWKREASIDNRRSRYRYCTWNRFNVGKQLITSKQCTNLNKLIKSLSHIVRVVTSSFRHWSTTVSNYYLCVQQLKKISNSPTRQPLANYSSASVRIKF